jgi:hypothetical protein
VVVDRIVMAVVGIEAAVVVVVVGIVVVVQQDIAVVGIVNTLLPPLLLFNVWYSGTV